MTIRIMPSLCLLALLAACKPAPSEMTVEERDARPPVEKGQLGVNEVACALGGAKVLADVCAVERIKARDGLLLIVRHPDGGFRRFAVTGDGLGVASADGADKADVQLVGNEIEVTVGDDRYRFPVTVKTHEKP